MANTTQNYIENYISLVFNAGAETVTFSNWEVSQDVTLTDGYESELFVSESGKGFTMQNFKGRKFSFLLAPNLTAETRKKLMRVQELTAVQYQMKFYLYNFVSYVPNFPPSTTPSYTPTQDLPSYSVNFADAVISYTNESTEKIKQGLGLRVGLDQSLSFTVMESLPALSLFPCAQVLDSMFDFSVSSNEVSPGVWDLYDYTFFLNLSQTFIAAIISYPEHGEYWVNASSPFAPGTGNILDKDLIGDNYNDQLGPYTWNTGDVLTIRWTGVILQLASGVLCNDATVTITFTVG
jgi:hypothetical protein